MMDELHVPNLEFQSVDENRIVADFEVSQSCDNEKTLNDRQWRYTCNGHYMHHKSGPFGAGRYAAAT